LIGAQVAGDRFDTSPLIVVAGFFDVEGRFIFESGAQVRERTAKAVAGTPG
jgi:hypothetical protein